MWILDDSVSKWIRDDFAFFTHTKLLIAVDSNESKLGADGKPIYDANGKFLKGPNYWKPEPKIQALLEAASK